MKHKWPKSGLSGPLRPLIPPFRPPSPCFQLNKGLHCLAKLSTSEAGAKLAKARQCMPIHVASGHMDMPSIGLAKPSEARLGQAKPMLGLA